jgi:ketosteroid isomerase-like protein
VAIGEYLWRSKVTGRVFDAHFVHVVNIRDGKIYRFREYTDTAAAVAAMVD